MAHLRLSGVRTPDISGARNQNPPAAPTTHMNTKVKAPSAFACLTKNDATSSFDKDICRSVAAVPTILPHRRGACGYPAATLISKRRRWTLRPRTSHSPGSRMASSVRRARGGSVHLVCTHGGSPICLMCPSASDSASARDGSQARAPQQAGEWRPRAHFIRRALKRCTQLSTHGRRLGRRTGRGFLVGLRAEEHSPSVSTVE
jgi:hypothetical protein